MAVNPYGLGVRYSSLDHQYQYQYQYQSNQALLSSRQGSKSSLLLQTGQEDRRKAFPIPKDPSVTPKNATHTGRVVINSGSCFVWNTRISLEAIHKFKTNWWSCQQCPESDKSVLVAEFHDKSEKKPDQKIGHFFELLEKLMSAPNMEQARVYESALNTSAGYSVVSIQERPVVLEQSGDVFINHGTRTMFKVQKLEPEAMSTLNVNGNVYPITLTQKTYVVFANDYKKDGKHHGVGVLTTFNGVLFPPDSISNGRPSPFSTVVLSSPPSSPTSAKKVPTSVEKVPTFVERVPTSVERMGRTNKSQSLETMSQSLPVLNLGSNQDIPTNKT